MFKKIKILFSFSLIVLINSSIAFGLESGIRFQHLTIEDGLPQNSVTTVLQDSTGFIWFGTEEGLVKYDGYNLKTFKHDPYNKNSLSGNYIASIFEDNKGGLWIGTIGNGLNHFNPKTEEFYHYRYKVGDSNSLSHDDVWSIIEGDQDNLWIGTMGGGLNHFNTTSRQFTHYRHQSNDPNTISNDSVWSIVKDNQENLWIGTNGGLSHFDTKNKKFSHYKHQVNDTNSISHDHVRSVLEDSIGNLWIGTIGGGLNYLNIETKQFTQYSHQNDNSNSLSHDFVWSIIKDHQDNLWVGTYSGLNYFNTKTKEFRRYRNHASDPSSLSHDFVSKVFKDNQGNLWVGTIGGGVSYFNTKAKPFNLYSRHPSDLNSLSNDIVWSVIEDSQGDLWLGTYSGLNHLNTQNNRFTHYRHQPNDPSSLSHDDVWDIVEDSQKNLWIGTYSGLNHFDIKTRQFTQYRHQIDNINSLSNDSVGNIIEDSTGNLWLGTYGGLNHYNTKTKLFTHYRHNVNEPNSLSDDTILSMTSDRKGNLWIGTGDGLNHFNIKTKQFTHYIHQSNEFDSLSNNSVISIFEDSKGNLWVGTESGLNLFNSQTETFKRYTTRNGIPNDVIHSIEEDDQGYIWLSTNHGLSRMTPKEEIFRNYDVGDGLQSNQFNSEASFKSKTGELFFGGISGFNRFNPEKIIDDNKPPIVVLTDIRLLNQPVQIIPISNRKANTKSLLDSSSNNILAEKTTFTLAQVIHKTKEITLTYKDNIVAFEFSTLHFSNPKKNQFAYQLVGWDKDWVFTDYKNRRATYTNLPDGYFTFRVKASNADGFWSEQGASLQITVLPPPWKTWWAYTLYGVFLLSLVLAFIHSQRKKVTFERNVNAQLESKVVQRTSQLQNKTEELQKSYSMLEKISLTDQLTGLKNRRFLLNNIENDIALVLRKYKSSYESNGNNKPEAADLIFFIIDLDHFKMVNDIHGHTAGDAVLIQIKLILEQVFRETDYLVRWGGEEFLVIARFTERSNAPELAERLRQAVEDHNFDIGENKILKKTCSIGFACYPFSTKDTKVLTWQQVVDVADHCMYAAKKSNRNAWVGLYAKTNKRDDDLFTAVIEKTQPLILSEELKMLSSITEIDQVIWMVGE